MKLIKRMIVIALVAITFYPQHTIAENTVVQSGHNKTEAAQAKVLLARLEVIHQHAKKRMSTPEKAAMRTEVKAIQKQLKTMDGGIYLSVGAIIIILLIIIIIF